MAEFSMVRLRRVTNRKLVKLQEKINNNQLSLKNKGEIIDMGMDALKRELEE